MKARRHDQEVWDVREGPPESSEVRVSSGGSRTSSERSRLVVQGLGSKSPPGCSRRHEVVGALRCCRRRPGNEAGSVALGEPALSLLDVIPVVTHSSREFGESAYRNTKGRRVSALGPGYAIRNPTRPRRKNDRRQSPTVCVYAVAFNPL